MTKTDAMAFVVDCGADDAPMGGRLCHCSIPLGPEFSRTCQRQAERGQRSASIQLSWQRPPSHARINRLLLADHAKKIA
jgi:hypothetical protein